MAQGHGIEPWNGAAGRADASRADAGRADAGRADPALLLRPPGGSVSLTAALASLR